MRRFSGLTLRLLAFNLLLVFLPAAGLLYLDIYEKQELEAQERSMVQQGRVLAAALSGREDLSQEEVARLLRQLNRRLDARLRVVDRQGLVLGDTSRFGPRLAKPPAPEAPPARRNVLYRVGAFFYDLYKRIVMPPEPVVEPEPPGSSVRLEGKEIQAALSGRYGRATRVTPGQRSVTLTSVIPIEGGGRVLGAVVVTQSTYRILQDLYAVRTAIFRVCVFSFLAAIVLSVLVATTIARPIRRLRDEAEAILDRSGRLTRGFRGPNRRDEIGDLARALEELTRRLDERLRSLESFASDVAHELKNPLASIRTATEMLAEVENPRERRRFLDVVEEEVARMEHQLSELAEITRIDARLEAEEQVPVALNGLLARVAERFRMRENGRVHVLFEPPEEIMTVRASPDRLTQIFENVLENATSLTAGGGSVRVTLARCPDGAALVAVSDEGPGIPEAHLERIFERFFSYRPGDSDKRHAGLGLAIVKAIVEGYGGRVTAANNADCGATFTVRLPASRTGIVRQSS